MGSLPNLRSLSKDPNTTYKFEISDPEEAPRRSAKHEIRSRNPGRLPIINNNPHNEFNRFRINREQNPQLVAQLIGKHQRGVHNCKVKNPRQHHHHHKVRHTRSSGSQYNHYIQNGGTVIGWEHVAQLQMSSTSPNSNRSSRSNYVTGPGNNVLFNVNHTSNKRKESMSRLGPVYSRRVLCRNFAALCLGHATITAALLPLLSLQSSMSIWWWPFESFQEKSDVGSLLLSGSFAIAGVFTLLTPCIMHVIGSNWTLVIGYMFASAFFVTHLYPTIRWLVPAYILLGVSLGPIACAKISCMITLANKLTYVMTEEEEEYEQATGDAKDNMIRKLSRGLQAAQDIGIMVGNAVAWCFLHYSHNAMQERKALEGVFQVDEAGERICGSQSCPLFTKPDYETGQNSTLSDDDNFVVPCRTTALLASVFVGCGVVAVGLTATFTDKIKLFVYQDPLDRPVGVAAFQIVKSAFKDIRLQLAAPLSIFIGLQQGFMLADFSKWYVVCSLGVPNISLVFLSMSLLQSIAAFTLSLLMQNVPRFLVIVAGFIFHSCLLLVLLTWKPSGDDSALFYVIAAAWGVCNIIWEILNFTLLMHIYPDSIWQIAFVHGNFFKFIGLSIAFGLHGAVCTWVKLYGLAAFMIIGLTPHIWLEIKLEARRKVRSGIRAM